MKQRTAGHGWPHPSVLVVACTLGAVVGVFGWSAREAAMELSAAALEVDLIAGPVGPELDEDVGQSSGLVGAIYYQGRRAVSILEARPAGWVPVGDAARPTPVLPREWTSVPLAAAPDCTAQVRPELDLLVRTERGVRPVTVPLRQDSGYLALFHQSACQWRERADIEVVDAEALPIGDGALAMRLGLRRGGTPDDREITVLDVTGQTAGFRATSSGPPVTLPPGETQTVTVQWDVEECALTDDLAEVELVVLLESQDVGRRNQVMWMPGHVVASLARFGVAECAH